MGKKNIQLANDILNEVGHFIIATAGQHSLDWDEACYVSSTNPLHKEGEFYLFKSKKPVSFKSTQLINTLFRLFEAYKVALNDELKDVDVSIKYIIHYSDLRVDFKFDQTVPDKWNTLSAPNPLNPYDFLIEDNIAN